MSARRDSLSRRWAAAPAGEGEYVPEGNDTIRSMSSDESTHILFENQTDTSIKLFWINYDGNEVPYRSIQPGKSHRQQTFLTHPWTFKAVDSKPNLPMDFVVVNDSRVVFPDENRNAPESKKVLQRPDGWDWDMDSHAKRFPTEFIDATQTFLLCYDRMRKRYMKRRLALAKAKDGESPTSVLPKPRGGSPFAEDEDDDDDEIKSDLGVLPLEIVLKIIEDSAPFVPKILHPKTRDPLDYRMWASNQTKN